MVNGGKCAREVIEEREQKFLDRRIATSSTDPRFTERQHPCKPDSFRPAFHRDYTRILHCRAFRRLRHKTQVFISPKNDHVCTRMEHSLHVASVAQTIARALGLNDDLVAAIAVGHDLGHAPFGHMGEKALQELAAAHSLNFSHELHSLRVIDFLDSPYLDHNGLNLTFAVRDGIVCHYGEGFEQKLAPDPTKDPKDLERTKRGESRPATLEGCVVRWADKVAYLGRDLEDAKILRLVHDEDLPESVRRTLGTTNREIIGALVGELCRTTTLSDPPEISVDAEIHRALNDLYDFNMNRIYRSPEATKHRDHIGRAMKDLFTFLLDQLQKAKGDLDALPDGSGTVLSVFKEFLRDDIRNWKDQPQPQLVLDFIAGMTDSFFNSSFTELFVPQSVV